MNKSKEIMAKTMYGEARGEYAKYGIDSFISIGNVIMNRAKKSKSNIEDICLKPKQFSCWNKDDPNKKIIENITNSDKLYAICLDTAEKIINEKLPDITNGANHYYSMKMKTIPKWTIFGTVTTSIGNHIFLKL